MKSQIVIEIESDKKDTEMKIKTTSYISSGGTDLHKESVSSLKRSIDKIIEKATS